MNSGVRTRISRATVVAVALVGFTAAPALAGWSFSLVNGCDDGYEWVTRTVYRTELRPLTKIYYRTERHAVTVWTTERRLVEEVWYNNWGCRRTRLVWKDVQVPRTEYRVVQVPYEVVVYEYVQVPHTECIRVVRPGFSVQTRNFSVQVGGGGFAFSLRGGAGHRTPPLPLPQHPGRGGCR